MAAAPLLPQKALKERGVGHCFLHRHPIDWFSPSAADYGDGWCFRATNINISQDFRLGRQDVTPGWEHKAWTRIVAFGLKVMAYNPTDWGFIPTFLPSILCPSTGQFRQGLQVPSEPGEACTYLAGASACQPLYQDIPACNTTNSLHNHDSVVMTVETPWAGPGVQEVQRLPSAQPEMST